MWEVSDRSAGHDIATSVQQELLASELGVEDVVVHIEPEVEDRS